MSGDRLQTLTEEEQRTAEKYHNAVYSFLHRHGYSIEQYYDVAIMGFLKGIQKYNRDETLQQYSILTVCEYKMMSEISQHRKKENAKCRKPEGGLCSLNKSYFQGENGCEKELLEFIPTETLEDEFFRIYDEENAGERIKEILKPYTELQRKIILLKADGCTHWEIARILNITFDAVGRELRKIRNELPSVEQKERSETIIEKYIGVSQAVLSTIKLTSRQMEVIELLLLGLTEAEVGRRLGLKRQAVYDALKKTRAKAARVSGY